MIFKQRQHLLLPWMSCSVLLFILVLTSSSVMGETEGEVVEAEDGGNSTVKRNVTGIPQIDYLTDPNLPRELNGYNLSTYPFHTRVPSDIDFDCKDLKGGFYANIEHKCQIYHHCLFGTRYDFLCANYTAFDQRTFICQFVSEVDCENSHLFFHRNEALYITPTTTTVAPSISINVPIGGGRRIRPATLTPVSDDLGSASDYPAEKDRAIAPAPDRDRLPERERERDRDRSRDRLRNPNRRRNRRRCGPGRRRKCRRPPPRDYDEYDDYEDYYDTESRRGNRGRERARDRGREDEYEDYETEEALPAKKRKTKNANKDSEDAELGQSNNAPVPLPPAAPKSKSIDQRPSELNTDDQPLDPLAVAANREKLFTKSRAPPKIRPPVPVHEKRKYNGIQGRPTDTTSTPSTTTTATKVPPPAEYDDEYYDEEYETPTTVSPLKNNRYLPTSTPPTTTTTTTTTTHPPPVPASSEYEYEYEDYEAEPHTTTTTTTVKPLRGFGPRRSQSQSRLTVTLPPDTTSESRNNPGEEHLKINEALETPSRPSFRQPYLNRPRPDFVRNSQMLQPITTQRTTTTQATTTTTTSERPGFGSTFDGMNRRFPAFDDSSRSQAATSAAAADRARNSRFRQRQPTKGTTSTTVAPVEDEYAGYGEQEMPERYGQKSIGSYLPDPPRRPSPEEDFSEHSQYMTPAFDHQTQPQYQHTLSEIPPTNPSYQIYRQRDRNPPVQTNFVTPYAPSSLAKPTSSTRPEFISLLSDDEDSGFYSPANNQPPPQIPSSRFRRPLLTSAQEVYPQYLRPPPYISSLRPRNSFPQIYSPFNYGNF